MANHNVPALIRKRVAMEDRLDEEVNRFQTKKYVLSDIMAMSEEQIDELLEKETDSHYNYDSDRNLGSNGEDDQSEYTEEPSSRDSAMTKSKQLKQELLAGKISSGQQVLKRMTYTPRVAQTSVFHKELRRKETAGRKKIQIQKMDDSSDSSFKSSSFTDSSLDEPVNQKYLKNQESFKNLMAKAKQRCQMSRLTTAKATFKQAMRQAQFNALRRKKEAHVDERIECMKKYVKDTIRNKKVAAQKQEMLTGLQDKFLQLTKEDNEPEGSTPSRNSRRSSKNYRGV